MIIHGVEDTVHKLNRVPPKGGVSLHLSPHSILMHQRVDYQCHCVFTHGESVQTAEDEVIKNDMKPRSLDCVCLNPIYGGTGGHQLLNLAMGRMIERKKIWTTPLTLATQRRVEALAAKDKIASFKFRSRFHPDDTNSAEVDDEYDEDDETCQTDDSDDSDSDDESSVSSDDAESTEERSHNAWEVVQQTRESRHEPMIPQRHDPSDNDLDRAEVAVPEDDPEEFAPRANFAPRKQMHRHAMQLDDVIAEQPEEQEATFEAASDRSAQSNDESVAEASAPDAQPEPEQPTACRSSRIPDREPIKRLDPSTGKDYGHQLFGMTQRSHNK